MTTQRIASKFAIAPSIPHHTPLKGNTVANNQRWIFVAASVLSIAASNVLAAEAYYLGAEIASDRLAFQPKYNFASGAPAETYDNKASGMNAGVLAGYRWTLSPDFSIALQGRLAGSDAKWQLETAEPASLKYSIPVNAAVSLIPTFQVSKNLSLFAEGGLALGRVQLQKSAISASMYDVQEWLTGGIAGAGVSYALDERLSVQLGYRRTWYNEVKYDTHLANGSLVETVRDKPVQSQWSIGLIRAF
jgi:opacity protein-like surface antigen